MKYRLDERSTKSQITMKLYPTVRQAMIAMANKIASERESARWTILQTENGWYYIGRVAKYKADARLTRQRPEQARHKAVATPLA